MPIKIELNVEHVVYSQRPVHDALNAIIISQVEVCNHLGLAVGERKKNNNQTATKMFFL